MKLLVVSDIHSNPWALDAILQVEKDVDLFCCAGDLVDYGTAPDEVIDRVRGISKGLVVQGNHDLHAVDRYREGGWNQVRPEDYKWVHHNCRRMNQEHIGYLERLPGHIVFEADGYVYLMKHQYDHAYGTIQSSWHFDRFWETYVPKTGKTIKGRRVIFGHTHRQGVHLLDDETLWLNPGSASYRRPDDPDKTAHYAVVENGRIRLRRTAYDRSPLLREAEQLTREQGMMETELQDFFFFFGDAATSREPLPEITRTGE